jgi:hypothetical protein
LVKAGEEKFSKLTRYDSVQAKKYSKITRYRSVQWRLIPENSALWCGSTCESGALWRGSAQIVSLSLA